MAAPFFRLTHTGIHADGSPNANPVYVSDLSTGLEHQFRKVAVYVPVGGSIDIPATSRATLSFEGGDISQFTSAGVITVVRYEQPDVFTNVTRPVATAFPVGASIWNSDDNARNYSDGTNWRDSVGNLT